MSKLSRRNFIKLGAGSALALSTTNLLNNCSSDENGVDPDPEPNPEINAYVSAVKGNNLSNMTRDAIDAVGGMSSIVDAGDKVFVKPNFVNFPWAQTNNCFINGECTKPEILIAIADECLKAGASEVIIGDGSHLSTFDWQYAVTFDRTTNLVQEAQRLSSQYSGSVTLACLESDSPGWTNIPTSNYLGMISVSNLVTNADKVISVPVAKTHSWAQLTLALKNFIGIISCAEHGELIDNSWWNRSALDHSTPAAIGQIYLDIVKVIKPALSVIDFSYGVEGNGPNLGHGGHTVNVRDRIGSHLILASTDIMAADATAARVMSHNIGSIAQLTMGAEMGLGEINLNSIELLGEKLDDIKMAWLPASLQSSSSLRKAKCPFYGKFH